MDWTPFPDQAAAVTFALGRSNAGIFAKPGTGKTAITLAVLEWLMNGGEANAAIIVVPINPMYHTWPAEISKWKPKFGGQMFSVGILHGPKKDKVLGEKHDVYLINPEGIAWLATQKIPKRVDTLVVDESTKFKSHSAIRFKLLRKMLGQFDNRYILTGTPQPRSIADLWAQVCLLDGGKRLGGTISEFRRRYMVDVAPRHVAYPDWQPMPGAMELIYAAIADLCITIERRWTTTPTFNTVPVELPSAAMRAYRELENLFYADLSSGVVTVANAAAKSMKMRQLTGGQIYDDAAGVHHVHDAKIAAMLDFIEEMNGEPLIVACIFRHEADAIRAALYKAFKRDIPYFGGGGVKGDAFNAAIRDWNAGQLPVLLLNPSTAAHGLNLQHGGSSILWYTPTYNWEEYEQLNARVNRQGQTKQVVISHLIAMDTVDQLVYNVLSDRTGADRALFKHFKEKADERTRSSRRSRAG